jgi:hypothetical protein
LTSSLSATRLLVPHRRAPFATGRNTRTSPTMDTASVLSEMNLPWEAMEDDGCGNYGLACALAEASPAAKAARLAPEARPAARLSHLLKQLDEPLFPNTIQKPDPKVKAERAAAAAAAGPITADTVFEPQPLHFKMPHGYWMREGCAVAVDEDDLVYVFCRGNMPVLVFDIDGNLVNAWGNPTPFAGSTVFKDPYGNPAAGWIGNEWVSTHGIFVDHEGYLWYGPLQPPRSCALPSPLVSGTLC